jgi:hypothetical protein
MTSLTGAARRGLSHAWRKPTLPAWPRLVASLAIAVAAWIVWAPTLRTIFKPVPHADGSFHESFNDGLLIEGEKVEATGFGPCPDGWCLGAASSGTFIYRFVAQHELPFLKLWFYVPENGQNRLWVSTDRGANYRLVSRNTRLRADTVDLGVRVSAGQQVWLKFEADNPGVNQALVIDECTVVFLSAAPTNLPRGKAVFGIVVSFGLAVVVLCRRWPLTLSTVLILALGAMFRYEQAFSLLHVALEPDAVGYRVYAMIMRPFTLDAGLLSGKFGVREPLFIFMAWIYAQLFGDSDFGLRLLTVILSTVSIWAVLRLARGLFGVAAGQVVGLLLAVNSVFIQEAPRGLRMEFEVILCMAYFGAAFVKVWSSALRAAIALSLLGGLLVLTRATYLPVVLVLNAYALFRPGTDGLLSWGWVKSWAAGMAVTVLILAAMIAPYRYNMYRIHNDAFFDGAMYARWLANFEFAGRPGYPSVAELQKDAYIGPAITYGEYLFGLHTPSELIVGTARGFWKLYRQMLICPLPFGRSGMAPWCGSLDAGFQIVAAIGLILALGIPRYRWIPLALVLFALPISYLYDHLLLEPHRHTYHGYPLVLFAAVLTVTMAWNAIAQRRFAPAALQPEAR